MALNKVQTSWLAVVMLVAAAGIGAFLWQRNQNDDEVMRLRQQLIDSGIEIAQSEPTSDAAVELAESADEEAANNCNPSIVHEPTGLFSDTQRMELAGKLSHPLRDYYADESSCPASINISVESESDEYIVHVIFGHDKYTSFLYGDKAADSQPWWFPECLDAPCEFSDAFRAAYPEVVEAAGL